MAGRTVVAGGTFVAGRERGGAAGLLVRAQLRRRDRAFGPVVVAAEDEERNGCSTRLCVRDGASAYDPSAFVVLSATFAILYCVSISLRSSRRD